MIKRKILLIDDQRDMVTLVQGLLTREGYEVITAYDGLEGLEKLKENDPHLIVLDINMPRLDGAAFYERIYDASTGRARYPVLVLTARANLEELFTKLNVDGFMIKPYEIEDLLAHLQMILYRRYGKSGGGAAPAPSAPRRERQVLIAETHPERFDRTIAVFAQAGYTLRTASNGVDAIEQAFTSPPDLLMMNIDLPDLAGDVVAMKLRQMPKTADLPILLYMKEDLRREYSVIERIKQKITHSAIVESDDPRVLLKEADQLLNPPGRAAA